MFCSCSRSVHAGFDSHGSLGIGLIKGGDGVYVDVGQLDGVDRIDSSEVQQQQQRLSIIAHSNVEISSPKSVEEKPQEEEVPLTLQEQQEVQATSSTEGRIVRLQEPFVPQQQQQSKESEQSSSAEKAPSQSEASKEEETGLNGNAEDLIALNESPAVVTATEPKETKPISPSAAKPITSTTAIDPSTLRTIDVKPITEELVDVKELEEKVE